ncbi:MAG: VWA domain-containing protein [Actinomycetota bacterium]
MSDLAAVAAGFGQLLHEAGVPVTPERSARFARAIVLAEPDSNRRLYWLGRSTLLSGPDQIDVFDRVFAQVFGGLVDPADHRGDPNAPPPAHVRPGEERGSGGGRDAGASGHDAGTPSVPLVGSATSGERGDDDERLVPVATASGAERLRTTDFASLTEAELRALAALMARLEVVLPHRSSRRTRRSARGDEPDVRATLRRGHRTGGDPVRWERRRRRHRPRRLVVLLDISGSMEPYARAWVQFLHGAAAAAEAEVFTFATRLTRLTRSLRTRDPQLALTRAAAEAPDWSGGTRIGAAVGAFNDRFGRRGMARGAVVVVVSDGWEREDPAELGEQMARLSRLAHRIDWVNPRRADDRYEPLVGGMAAALPHCDAFVSGHSVAALDEVLAAIAAG